MQHIELPDDQFQRLTAVAQAAGYDDVTAFIASLADQPIEDPRGTLTDAELKESANAINEAIEEMRNGGGHDIDEVMEGIAAKYGFTLPR